MMESLLRINNYRTNTTIGRTLPFVIRDDSSYIPIDNILYEAHDHSLSDVRTIIGIVRHFSISSAPKLNFHDKNVLNSLDIFSEMYKSISKDLNNTLKYRTFTSGVYYKELFSNKWLSDRLCKIGDNLYISGTNTLFYYDRLENVFIPLYIMVLKKEHVRYVRQCIILNKEIHPDAVKLLVNDELDVTNGRYRLLRPKYRKYIKKPLLEKGVIIEEFSNLDHIYSKFSLPKVQSISEYNESLDNLGREFLENLNNLNSEELKEFEFSH